MASIDRWLEFFNGAGLPKDAANTYAHSFHENRIQLTMLQDLNKEYLRDLGVYRTGDIILVLKAAKKLQDSGSLKQSRDARSRSRSPLPAPKRKTIVETKTSAPRVVKRERTPEQVKTKFKITNDRLPSMKAVMDLVESPKNGKPSNSIFARLGSKSAEAEKQLISQTKTLTLTKNSPKQRVLLVKKVPAKATVQVDSEEEEDARELAILKSRSVKFSSQDEVMEFSSPRQKRSQGILRTNATIKDRLGPNTVRTVVHKKPLKAKPVAAKSKILLKKITLKSDEMLNKKTIHQRIGPNKPVESRKFDKTRSFKEPSLRKPMSNDRKKFTKHNPSVFERLGVTGRK